MGISHRILTVVAILAFVALPAFAAPTRSFTDMTGRTVKVPVAIHKVFCMGPPCQILIYALAPDLLAGWNYPPEPGEAELLIEPYRRLPVLGGWFGKSNTGNLEQIVKVKPDVMISIGDPMATAVAERVQAQIRIPVVVGDWQLKSTGNTLRMLGRLVHREKRAEELARISEAAIAEVERKVAAIPQDQRRRVYYAEGPKGLATDPGNSFHSEAIVFAGGINVAKVPQGGNFGQTNVSPEQILMWNPDIIIAGYDHVSSPGQFYRSVWSDPFWRKLKAVQNKEVFEAPQYPFNWIDRPPAVNRIIGIKWLANLLYPDRFHYDIRKETRNFYAKFYHRTLTDAELDKLLAQAVRK
jgi:iron complex transport system substrate-binding protein